MAILNLITKLNLFTSEILYSSMLCNHAISHYLSPLWRINPSRKSLKFDYRVLLTYLENVEPRTLTEVALCSTVFAMINSKLPETSGNYLLCANFKAGLLDKISSTKCNAWSHITGWLFHHLKEVNLLLLPYS